MARYSKGGVVCVRVTVFLLFSFSIIFLYFSHDKKNVVIHGDAKSDMLSGDQKTPEVTEKAIEEFQGALEENKVVEFDIKISTTPIPSSTLPTSTKTTHKTTQRAVEDIVQTTGEQSNEDDTEEKPVEKPAEKQAVRVLNEKNNLQIDSNGCPSSVLTISAGGRVANCIWEYLSIFSLAKFLPGNRVPYVPKTITETLSQIFENVSLPQLESIPKDCPCSRNTDWKTPNVDLYDFIPLHNVQSKFAYKQGNIILSTYSLLLEPVLQTLEEIKKVLTYKEEFLAEATKTLNTVKRVFLNSNNNIKESDISYIGIHARRTDYLEYVKSKFNFSVVGADYFEVAMKYFRERPKFGKPVFLVTSDDMVWAEKYLVGPDVFFASKGGPKSPGHDLALLSNCNHSIIDYGTFGLWTAIYAGGETISVKTTTQVQKILGNRPNWHLVDINRKEGLVVP